jgi:CheY-like chemotaxis protein
MFHAAVSKPTILIVDDDWLMLRLVSEMLKLAGYATLEASHPEKALQIFEENRG